MEDPTVGGGGRRRSKGAEATARASALERLKALREGRRAEVGFQVKVEEPIYDTVGEDDYAALVAKRRQAAQDFIVDDGAGDSLGYRDEGEEEDWARAHFQSSSGSEAESERPVKKKKQPAAERPKKPSAAAASLSAAAALMGKQRLSSMFTSAAFTKKGDDRVKGSASESLVEDIIAEFAPDEADRERYRQKQLFRRNSVQAVNSTASTLMGNQSLPSFFTSPVFTKMGNDRIKGSAVESTCVIAEFATDEADRQRPSPAIYQVNTEAPTNVDNSAIVEPDWESVSEKFDTCKNGQTGGCENGPAAEEIKENTALGLLSSNGGSTSEARNDGERKVEVKKEKGEKSFALNAKISVEKKPVPSASAGWKEVCKEEIGSVNGGADDGMAIAANGKCDDKSEFVLDSDGSLPFYMIDAHEEVNAANSGTLYLFGKIKAGSSYLSCCVIVKNMERCIYAIPNESVFQNNVITEMERNVAESQLPQAVFRTKLQDMAAELKSEVAERLMGNNVSTFSMAPVKRSYAFERSDIPVGEQYVLKVNYPFKDSPLSFDLKGEHFSALLGTHTSALELFLVKRKIKGPTWLSLFNFVGCPPPQRVSWCKFEVTVNSPKDVKIPSSSKALLEIPPVVVTAINLKTLINEKQNVNEIVSASIICCHKAKIDTPMLPSEWKKPGSLSHFTAVRKLEGGIFPMGFAKEVSDRNTKAGSSILGFESSERALLNRLMIELHKLDSDVLVGHNISGFDLDVLLHRAQACKVPSSMWSKVGRLKRNVMPRLTKGSSVFGSGASLGIISCMAGRLLCDTYLCSRDLLKEVSYSLTELARTQLHKERKEIAPHDIPNMFQASETLFQLVECGETDAWLSLELMFHLSMLPLTRQLTNISGNLWGKTLQGARAQRVEYLLLHEFHSKKFILPDKANTRAKESTLPKRKVGHNKECGDDDLNVDNGFENDDPQVDKTRGKKGPAYAGGLVLEPKKGLYDKFILLLDFNSLYPSIIQEYNICFTTVEKTHDGSIPSLPSSRKTGVLPKLLKILVERRRKVKEWLKSASGLKVQQLDIQQQALKLTANSIYGCLGFPNSRFYAKPLAELITLQGREILQSTVDLVQNNLNLEVIYGDTDSIMIYTGLDDIVKARAIAGKVIQEVNKKYRCLEIDLDGLYKRMLLLKKKKYAAVKMQFKDGTSFEVIERKGLDMVRRDWSMLSKELGDFCLRQILSGGSCEDVVETIHGSLMKVQEEMRNGEVALEKYIITKSLTKPPEDYPDAKNQPHVQVALRLKQNGYSTGCSAGDTVPYIICCQQGNGGGSSAGIAQRARHPDELKKDHGDWLIDIDYYLSQQIHPVVSRLCASIQGTSPARLADCLGLDLSRFQNKTTEAISKDPPNTLLGLADNEERFRGCEPLWLSCPSCSSAFECPSISTFIFTSANEDVTGLQAEKEPSDSFWRRFRCPNCPIEVDGARFSAVVIANQVKRQVDKFISTYYMGLMMCDDEMCKYATRTLNLRVIGDSERGTVCPNYPRCNGHLVRQYTEADLYKQLSYFCHVLDSSRCIEKMEYGARVPFEKEFSRIRQMVDLAVSTIQKIRDRCAYGWIQLKDLTVNV